MMFSVAVACAAQTTALLQGRVFDVSDAVLPGAVISVRDDSNGFAVSVETNADGRY